MQNKVASKVKATASSQKHPMDINKTGKWVLASAPVTIESQNIKSEKGFLLLSATAIFNYIGGSVPSPGGPVPVPPIPSPPLLLKAKSTHVSSMGQSVLVDGDETSDLFGNVLEISECSDQFMTE